jgi:hypothetical protein
MLISATGTPKQQLAAGERKSITTDRVILVPGPAQEVEVVKNVYWMVVGSLLTHYRRRPVVESLDIGAYDKQLCCRSRAT